MYTTGIFTNKTVVLQYDKPSSCMFPFKDLLSGGAHKGVDELRGESGNKAHRVSCGLFPLC